MSRIEFQLDKGLKVGDVEHRAVILREPTALDLIEAGRESETVLMVPVAIDDKGEPVREAQLVMSPTAMGFNTLRRQVVSIGDLKGPFDLEMIGKLSAIDLTLIQGNAEKLEGAAMKALTSRGRTEPAADAGETVD